MDIKVAQELLRHVNAKITLDLYTQAISSQEREANAKIVEMLLPAGGNGKNLSTIGGGGGKGRERKCLILFEKW